MATTENIGNPLGNILTDEKHDIKTRGLTNDAIAYVTGALLTYDVATGLYKRAIVADDVGATETVCDAVLYEGVDASVAEGVIILSGGVRASLLFGEDVDTGTCDVFTGLADAERFRIIGELADKNIIVGEL